MHFVKKIFFSLAIIGAIVGFVLKLPFGKWIEIDRLRFEVYSSVGQLLNHVMPAYTRASLLRKIKHPPTWMQDQIEENMGLQSPVDSSFSFQKIDYDQMVLVIIDKNGVRTNPHRLNAFDGRRRSVIEALQVLHQLGLLKPCQFLLSVADEVEIPTLKVPIFAFSKNIKRSEQRNLILLPDGMNLSRWHVIRQNIRYASRSYDWNQKKNIVFWRGSNTNDRRKQFCEVTQGIPYIDAKLVEGRDSAYEIPEMQLQYKYLISLDGTTSTWPGLLWKLASNSLVIKQDSPHIQWYYRALKPYVHYLPIQHDLKNIKAVYLYALQHDAEMKQISERAADFVKNNLSYEDMLVYLKLLLDAYCDKIYRVDQEASSKSFD